VAVEAAASIVVVEAVALTAEAVVVSTVAAVEVASIAAEEMIVDADVTIVEIVGIGGTEVTEVVIEGIEGETAEAGVPAAMIVAEGISLLHHSIYRIPQVCGFIIRRTPVDKFQLSIGIL
jgi:hypothetical protein